MVLTRGGRGEGRASPGCPHVLRLQQPLESSRDRQEPGLAAGAPDELHADRHAGPVAPTGSVTAHKPRKLTTQVLRNMRRLVR